jgi:hypothetical protein
MTFDEAGILGLVCREKEKMIRKNVSEGNVFGGFGWRNFGLFGDFFWIENVELIE